MGTSAPNRSKTKQKRSSLIYQCKVAPVSLPEEFPCQIQPLQTHNDHPITSLHVHQCMEIGYCHAGSGVFIVEGKSLPFSKGDLSVICGGERHWARSASRTFSQWTWIKLDPALLLPGDCLNFASLRGPQFRNIIRRSEDPLLSEWIAQIIQELCAKPEGYQTVARGLLLAFLTRLQRIRQLLPPSAQTARSSRFERIAPALLRITTHYAESIQIQDLARACHASIPHFRRIFRHTIHMSPHAYLTRIRIQMAAGLLTASDKPILQIASEVGYSTLSSFNRHFRSILKSTPRQWRQTH